jgi:hypothetical protein
VRVETALALDAEQVRGAHRPLAQHQLQVRVSALGTGFAHGAERAQVDWRLVIDVIENFLGIKFGQEQLVFGTVMAAAMCWLLYFVGRWFKQMFTHSHGSGGNAGRLNVNLLRELHDSRKSRGFKPRRRLF